MKKLLIFSLLLIVSKSQAQESIRKVEKKVTKYISLQRLD
tara:strand:+ start:317 stop:436 length:120 start_codon:yes stop_codon:yes gene_type:complete